MILGRLWEVLGGSWGHFGASQAAPGVSWVTFGVVLGGLGTSWGGLGEVLGRPGTFLGRIFLIFEVVGRLQKSIENH